MNREVGFGRKVLQILEDLNIRWEHMPTGIDDLSIVVRERELTLSRKKRSFVNSIRKWKLTRPKSNMVYLLS